jgi:DNA-binding transcriptional MerR regulator
MTRGTQSVWELTQMTGTTYRQLDYWERKGYITAPGGGSGVPREWDRTELAVATTMALLVQSGLQVAVAAKAAREIVDSGYPTTRIAPGITITVAGVT